MRPLRPRRSSGIAWLAGLVLSGTGLRAQAVGPTPELTLALRGIAAGVLEQGQGLQVAVRLEIPADSTGSVLLAPATGPWSEAIAVELRRVAGEGVVARARAAARPTQPHALLEAEQVAHGLYLFPAAETSGIATGEYTVLARLEIVDGPGWRGRVESPPATVRIEPASGSAAGEVRAALGRATEALASGSPESSAGILDALLARRPDEPGLLVMRALLSLAAGDLGAAQGCLTRARELEERAGSDHPSAELEEANRRLGLARSSRVQGGVGSVPPAWTSLPAAVLAPLPAKPTAATSAPVPAPGASPAGAPAVPPGGSAPEATSAPLPGSGGDFPGTVVSAAELAQAGILAEPSGQWAASAKAGSEYGSFGYSAMKATGPPDVPVAGDSPAAWCHASGSRALEWLELTFPEARPATEVRVRQNCSPGTIVKVEALEPDGTAHLWWEGVDPWVPPAVRDFAWFGVRVPATSYPVARIRLTLDLAKAPGWKQIDAVQLVGVPAR